MFLLFLFLIFYRFLFCFYMRTRLNFLIFLDFIFFLMYFSTLFSYYILFLLIFCFFLLYYTVCGTSATAGWPWLTGRVYSAFLTVLFCAFSILLFFCIFYILFLIYTLLHLINQTSTRGISLFFTDESNTRIFLLESSDQDIDHLGCLAQIRKTAHHER